jgi:hypothetical protein
MEIKIVRINTLEELKQRGWRENSNYNYLSIERDSIIIVKGMHKYFGKIFKIKKK